MYYTSTSNCQSFYEIISVLFILEHAFLQILLVFFLFFLFSRNYILWYLITRVIWTIFEVCRYRNRNLTEYIVLIVINLSVIYLLVQEIYLFYYLTSRARNLSTFAHDKLTDTQQRFFLHRRCVTICTCPSAYITVAAVLHNHRMGCPCLWVRYYFVVSFCAIVITF